MRSLEWECKAHESLNAKRTRFALGMIAVMRNTVGQQLDRIFKPLLNVESKAVRATQPVGKQAKRYPRMSSKDEL